MHFERLLVITAETIKELLGTKALPAGEATTAGPTATPMEESVCSQSDVDLDDEDDDSDDEEGK